MRKLPDSAAAVSGRLVREDRPGSSCRPAGRRPRRPSLTRTPARWPPPLADYRCAYGRAWISVKHVYGLPIDTAERSALEGMLDTCA